MKLNINDKALIKISLLLFLIIFLSTYLIETNINPKTKNINEISIKNLNQKIQIEGYIKEQYNSNNNTFLTLQDNNSEIKVAIFENNKQFNQTKKYLIIGKVTYYKKEIEIIAEKIHHIN